MQAILVYYDYVLVFKLPLTCVYFLLCLQMIQVIIFFWK